MSQADPGHPSPEPVGQTRQMPVDGPAGLPEEARTSPLAVAGFTLAFLAPPVGLALSALAIEGTGPGRARGRGLAVTGTAVGAVLSLAVALLVLGALLRDVRSEAAPVPEPSTGATGTTAPATEESASATPTTGSPAIGTAVTDRRFTFTVTSVERAGDTLDGLIVQQEAQGEYVIVRTDVTNTSDTDSNLVFAYQYGITDDGTRVRASPPIGVEGFLDGAFRPIAPGGSVTNAPLVFDVPAGSRLSAVELHEDYNTPGTVVDLGVADPGATGSP